LHAAEDLLGVATVRAGRRVGGEHDLGARRVHGDGADLEVAWQVALHDVHALVREAAGADVSRTILEVVLHDEADLRADVGARLHGCIDVLLRRVGRVLDLSAAGARRGAGLRAVSMHHAPQSDRGGFVAEYLELRFGDRRTRADTFTL